MKESITVSDGKYTVINDAGKLTALRNGEPWGRDLVGDNLIYWMFVRIRELEAAVALKSAPQHSSDAPSDAEKLLEAIGNATHRAGIYNGQVPLTGPLALMLLDDLTNQALASPMASPEPIQSEVHDLAKGLASAVLKDDADPQGHDISAGLFGPHVSAWLRNLQQLQDNAQVHEISGKTADELWLETGKLRAQIADMKAEGKSRQQQEPARAQTSPTPSGATRFMRPMISKVAVAAGAQAHGTKQSATQATVTQQDERPTPTSMRKPRP